MRLHGVERDLIDQGWDLDGDDLADRLQLLALAALVELVAADIGRPGQDAVNLSDAPASAVAREDASDGLALVRPLRGKRSCSVSGKLWADGAWIIDMMHVLSKTYGKCVWDKAQKLNTRQPYAPSRRRCF